MEIPSQLISDLLTDLPTYRLTDLQITGTDALIANKVQLIVIIIIFCSTFLTVEGILLYLQKANYYYCYYCARHYYCCRVTIN